MTQDRTALDFGLSLLGLQHGQPAEPPPPKPKPAPRVWTLGELLAAKFAEPVWVVNGLLPAGLAILGGRPKLGKSFLGLQLALAVGAGGRFLGRDVARGRALYIALEDSPRRLQGRLRDMGARALEGLQVAFGWPALNTPEGVDALAVAIRAQGLRLVVIDTLARGIKGRLDWDNLAEVTAMLGALQELALASDCCVLLIDHHRKGNGLAADAVDDVMGSTGKSAVADTIMGLYRKRGDKGASLAVTGRDIEEATLGLAFDGLTRTWQLDATAEGVRVGTVQDSILRTLEDLGAEATTSDLAETLGVARPHVSRELQELLAKRAVTRGTQGRQALYRLASTFDGTHGTSGTHGTVGTHGTHGPRSVPTVPTVPTISRDNGAREEPPAPQTLGTTYTAADSDAFFEGLTAAWDSG